MVTLKQAQAGSPIPELCCEHGMSSASFYKWRSKYSGMDTSLMARLKELEDENCCLKKCMLMRASRLKLFRRLYKKGGIAVYKERDGSTGSYLKESYH
jgi:putative transposase